MLHHDMTRAFVIKSNSNQIKYKSITTHQNITTMIMIYSRTFHPHRQKTGAEIICCPTMPQSITADCLSLLSTNSDFYPGHLKSAGQTTFFRVSCSSSTQYCADEIWSGVSPSLYCVSYCVPIIGQCTA